MQLTTSDDQVNIGARVSVQVRLWNTLAVPLYNIDLALIYEPSLQPAGGLGSSVVHTDYGVMNIERITRLDPGGYAEWWLVFRTTAPGEASARFVATLTDDDAAVESVQWQVGDAPSVPHPVVRNDDAVLLAQAYIEHSLDYRARGHLRNELHALYTARVFIEQAASYGQQTATTWFDVADRARELYEQAFGAGPAPLQQAPLPRSSVLTGIVLDKASQLPIADATVTLHSTVTDAIYAMVTTGADGTFRFPDLGAEPVVMVTEMSGYMTTMRAGFEMCPEATTRLITELEPKPVKLHQPSVESVDLAELHGTMTGYRGDGAPDVEIILVGTDTRAAVTDEHGEFRFTGITPGDYTFVAQKPGYAAIERGALNISPGGVLEVQFTLEPE
ncbi:MAG: carboxypeptidase regulatory-like domain-containing protein [Gammaproteobacteria bacterium]|nr:carboxypeptidase regulatory-like domain-containing protein [Gammaproteobacteria bacterium]